jgi:transcriptional regulator with XRE-family HTH domain
MRKFDYEMLRSERLRKGMSREYLCSSINVSRDTLKLWEHGVHKPSDVSIYFDWCEALGINPLQPVNKHQWWTDGEQCAEDA